MIELSTIQRRGKLNDVYAIDEVGVGNAHHKYAITKHEDAPEHRKKVIVEIQFQNGARNDKNAITGVSDESLLEIVRDRLKGFQNGRYATRENAYALKHIEEALMWLNERVEDRIERDVLGTYKR